MMTVEQHDMMRMSSELAELQQALGKAIQFGADDANPDTGENNMDAIQREMLDVLYFCKRLGIRGGIYIASIRGKLSN